MGTNSAEYRRINRCKTNRQAVEYTLRLKLEVLSHYGRAGALRCCWPGCDVSDIDMLSLDHVNDDGANDRRANRYKKTSQLYAKLRREGYPDGFQTLCYNHQWKKEILRRRLSRNGDSNVE